MRILIRVYKHRIRVQIGHGEIFSFYNWKAIFPIINHDDDVMIQDFTNDDSEWLTLEEVADLIVLEK